MKKIYFLFILILAFTQLHAEDTIPQNIRSLQTLSDANAPSGFERRVRKIIKQQWSPLVDKVKTDGLGNVITIKKGVKESPRLLLMAHMDEVGFMVKSIDKNGYLSIQNLGGWVDNVLLGQRWIIDTNKGPITAYTGLEAGHIMPKGVAEPFVRMDKMFLDIGASSREEAVNKFHIRVGLPISPYSKFTRLGRRRFLGKAFDDRAGLAVITETLKNIQGKEIPNYLMTAATVQEEVGLRGASTIYKRTKPDAVINLEMGVASDFPLLASNHSTNIALGKGPTLFVYDRSMIPNTALLEWIAKLAKKKHIPFQYELEGGYGEDGSRLQYHPTVFLLSISGSQSATLINMQGLSISKISITQSN